MVMMRHLFLFFLVILIIPFSEAATIFGSVYDVSLHKVNGARLEVNTTPHQHFISVNGEYSFNIPAGFYTIKAELIRSNKLLSHEWQNISVNQEGEYVLDFVLFPNLDENDLILGELEFNGLVEELDKSSTPLATIILSGLVGGLVVVLFFYFKRKKLEKQEKKSEEQKAEVAEKNQEQEKTTPATQGEIPQPKQEDQGSSEIDLQQIVDIIKKEGGRTTQKEIRKHIPLSEAKISLMIAELEHKGIVEKIKKGRGNVLVLKKDL